MNQKWNQIFLTLHFEGIMKTFKQVGNRPIIKGSAVCLLQAGSSLPAVVLSMKEVPTKAGPSGPTKKSPANTGL